MAESKSESGSGSMSNQQEQQNQPKFVMLDLTNIMVDTKPPFSKEAKKIVFGNNGSFTII